MEGIGDIVEVNAWEQPHLREEIRRLIAERKPDWVIAAGASATACLPLHGQRKVLVNPRVTAADLEGVPEYALRHTYGFFGALPEQEESYGLFQTVYPHAAWYACVPDLRLADIRELAVSIIAGGQTD